MATRIQGSVIKGAPEGAERIVKPAPMPGFDPGNPDPTPPEPDPVTPSGHPKPSPEWSKARAEETIKDSEPRKEVHSARAKILQKTVYLPAARKALDLQLPETATVLAASSKPLSQAWDRAAKKSPFIGKVVNLVAGSQSDTAILIGLHSCILSALALESGLVNRLIEKNNWLKENPTAQIAIATALASMMKLPQQLLVRADIESENLDEATGKLLDEAAAMVAEQEQRRADAYAQAAAQQGPEAA